MQEFDLLILGAGWTSTFLIPLLRKNGLTFAATTRDGRTVAGEKTIPWTFEPPSSDDKDDSQFSSLPLAKAVLVTFPLTGHGQSKALVKGYEKHCSTKIDRTSNTYDSGSYSSYGKVHFIQLGSTGIWQIAQKSYWVSRHSPIDASNARAIAENELLLLGGCVLNLAGLWARSKGDGARDPRNWVKRVAKTKEDVRNKKSLHMVHGLDVARSVVAVMCKWDAAKGQRWMVTDGFVYDWWELFVGWAAVEDESEESNVKLEPSEHAKWVFELMSETDIRALPRSMETLGRCYDSREFWHTFDIVPLKGRI